MELKEAKIRVLERTREVLSKGLCKGDFAKSGDKPTGWWEPDANKFCLIGAVRLACNELARDFPKVVFNDVDHRPLSGIIWDDLDDSAPGGNAVKFNDAPETTLDDVIAVLNQLIEKVRAS